MRTEPSPSARYNPAVMEPGSDRRRVIINADDLGFSPGVTEGILRAHREGVVTSTTLAANMPPADEAVGRLGEVPALGVGVHLNVSQGPALSGAGREALADVDGVMRRTAVQVLRRCLLGRRVLDAIEAECDAQVRWLLDRGVTPTHLDSHRHIHAFPPVFRRVARVARRYDVRFVRWHGERLPGAGWPACPPKQARIRWYTNLFAGLNARAADGLAHPSGTWGVAHTGRIDADWLVLAARRLPPGTIEIMTHPGLADDLDPELSRLRESRRGEMDALRDAAVAAAFETEGIERIHYGQL